MDSLEKHPDFDSVLKLRDTEESKGDSEAIGQSEAESKSHDKVDIQSESTSQNKGVEQSEEEEDMGLALFENVAKEPAPKGTEVPVNHFYCI